MSKKLALPLVFLLFALTATLDAQQGATPPALSVPQILAKMAANANGIDTYEVPVEIRVHVKKVISVPFRMSGERYFKRPDKTALKLYHVPAQAKGFSNLYASLGTPRTWLQTYDITLDNVNTSTGAPFYELRGSYKHPSNVDHILLDVDARTFDPIKAQWFYKNGATILMTIVEDSVEGKYRLPQHETVDINFPEYSGHATIDYGTYAINQPIDDAVFSQ